MSMVTDHEAALRIAELERELADALEKDARKTREYNILVEENRALLATHAEHLERANRLWDQLRALRPLIRELADCFSTAQTDGELFTLADKHRAAIYAALRAAQPTANPPK